MTTLLSLPDELLRSALTFCLDDGPVQTSLHGALLACKRLSRVAQPLLMRSNTLAHPRQVITFMQLVAKRPHLATHASQLAVQLEHDRHEKAMAYCTGAWVAMLMALDKLENLGWLRIYASPHWHLPGHTRDLLDSISKLSSLHTLDWAVCADWANDGDGWRCSEVGEIWDNTAVKLSKLTDLRLSSFHEHYKPVIVPQEPLPTLQRLVLSQHCLPTGMISAMLRLAPSLESLSLLKCFAYSLEEVFTATYDYVPHTLTQLHIESNAQIEMWSEEAESYWDPSLDLAARLADLPALHTFRLVAHVPGWIHFNVTGSFTASKLKHLTLKRVDIDVDSLIAAIGEGDVALEELSLTGVGLKSGDGTAQLYRLATLKQVCKERGVKHSLNLIRGAISGRAM